MDKDIDVWISYILETLRDLASRERQQKLWFWDGHPPMPTESSCPSEMMCWLGDNRFEEFLNDPSIYLTDQQKELGHLLLKQLRRYGHKAYQGPYVVIDDPEWCKIRETAGQLLESLEAVKSTPETP